AARPGAHAGAPQIGAPGPRQSMAHVGEAPRVAGGNGPAGADPAPVDATAAARHAAEDRRPAKLRHSRPRPWRPRLMRLLSGPAIADPAREQGGLGLASV